jgi:hypothetical protein
VSGHHLFLYIQEICGRLLLDIRNILDFQDVGSIAEITALAEIANTTIY